MNRDDLDLLILGTLLLVVIILLGIFEILLEQVETRMPVYAVVSRRRHPPYQESRYATQAEDLGAGREQGAS